MKKLIKRIARWINSEIFGRVSVLDVLEYANRHRRSGICTSIKSACFHYSICSDSFKDYCTKFNFQESTQFGSSYGVWWWPPREWNTGRGDFLEYLIKYYSEIPQIYIPKTYNF